MILCSWSDQSRRHCRTPAWLTLLWFMDENEKSLKMVDDDGGGGGRTNKCLWRNRNEEADSGAEEREEESQDVKFECDDLMRCQHTRQQRMLFLNYSTRYAKQSLCNGVGAWGKLESGGKDMRNEKLFSFSSSHYFLKDNFFLHFSYFSVNIDDGNLSGSQEMSSKNSENEKKPFFQRFGVV